MNPVRSIRFWLILLIIAVTVYLMVAAYFDWIYLSYRIDGLFFSHWLAWGGVLFIAIYTPIYYVLKRLYPQHIKNLVGGHVFGSLFSFLLISIHFAQQVSRPAQFFPEGRTGTALYIILAIIVATGVIHRFSLLKRFGNLGIPHRNRFVHVALALAFYVILFIHVLHNMGYL